MDTRAISKFADLKGQVELWYWGASEREDRSPAERYDSRLGNAHYVYVSDMLFTKVDFEMVEEKAGRWSQPQAEDEAFQFRDER